MRYMNAALRMLLLTVSGSTALGIGFIGTPTSNLDKGQFSIGFEYSYSSLSPDSSSMARHSDEYFNGALLNLSTADRLNLDLRDFDVNRYYGVIGYGVTDFWDLEMKLGAADIDGDARTDADWTGLDFGGDFALGWGTRVTLSEKDNVAWGVSVQMNWLDTEWSRSGASVAGPASVVNSHNVNMDSYDILIAAGPTIDMGGWRLYGGPFYYYLSGDIENIQTESTTFMGDTITRRQTSKGDYRMDALGGFVGVQMDLNKCTTLNCEFSATDDGWAVGAGIVFRF